MLPPRIIPNRCDWWVAAASVETCFTQYKLSTVVLGTSDMEQEQDLCFDNGFVSVVFDLTVLVCAYLPPPR